MEIPNYSDPCTVYPNINSTAATGPALAHNLTIEGNSTVDRGLARLVTGELRVYGDFVDHANGFIQRETSVFTLAGGNQVFAREPYQVLRVDGGGIKTVNNNGENVQIPTVIEKSLTLLNGIISTGPQTLSLADNSGATITGENDTNYILGIVQTYERAAPGTAQNFNNIGITLTFTGNDPGNVRVVRTTGQSVVTAGKPSISRTFGLQPDYPTGLSATAVFHYLNHETMNVTAGGLSAAQLDKSKLTFYVSGNGGAGFINKGRTSTDGATEVTLANLTQFATTTLGEDDGTLPVHMLYFTAIHAADGALLNWGTASELNNAGFDVQVSTDGVSFSTLATIKPAAATSDAP
ncbi:hypothetical protein [Hymenobacter sp. BRD67]|uniref:hypothetical protein n=1 Tax=Hymenobacter sp. BRD67 TaxID=2675877 RepID=UPI0015652334|nr:hypothetical protein [Hymenobacter sp. BRD67]QKG53777.1 hypothetical protein GKZ67_15700 [Hymenobacter sp. BRD67]